MTPDSAAKRILIVEDDQDLNDLISGLLRKAGYRVQQCFDGLSGLKTAKAESFNLVLLDVMLPHMDGFTLLNKLRRSSDVPVVMLTAKGAEQDRITGFKTGADDYLPKPFNFDELMLRIDVIMRRTYQALSRHTSSASTLTYDDLTVDNKQATASFAGQALNLTNMELRVLARLIQQPGHIQSKPYLYQEVLGRPYSRNERSLDVHISKLRRKLNAAGFDASRIETMHGQGYILR